MPDLGTVAAPAAFLTTLAGMLTYLGQAVLSDRKSHAESLDRERAQTQRAEDALERCREARNTAEQKLALAELQVARLSIEYGHSDNRSTGRGH